MGHLCLSRSRVTNLAVSKPLFIALNVIYSWSLGSSLIEEASPTQEINAPYTIFGSFSPIRMWNVGAYMAAFLVRAF